MEHWRHIQHNDANLPPLFLKAAFNKDGYSVHLTDLSRIWTESLEKKTIISQASRQDCSIDPSEDGEQFRIFLDSVRGALEQNEKTSLALTTVKGGHLRLRVETPLPAPLPPFEWEVKLTRAPDTSVKTEFVSPLVHRAQQLNNSLELLIAELQAKDKIIAKITDRLETSGHDLTAVFPGTAKVKLSRNKSQQEQLARHVRGLGLFDEDAFRKQISTGSEDTVISPESSDAIFASLPAPASREDSQAPDDWCHLIPSGQYVDFVQDTSEPANKSHNNPSTSGESPNRDEATDAAQDDAFQRQATPPKFRTERQDSPPMEDDEMDVDEEVPQPSHEPTSHHEENNDESTDDEDDLDGPTHASKPPPANTHPEPAKPHPREATPKSPSPPPAPKPKPSSHHDEVTDTEDSSDDLDKPSQPSQKTAPSSQLPSRQRIQTPQPPAPSPRRKPGTLGGRARTAEPPSSPATDEPENPSPKPKPKPKLGTLGGKKPQQPPPHQAPSKSPSPKPPSKKKPGTLGGKRAASPPNAPEPEPGHNESEPSAAAAAPSKRQHTGKGRQASPPPAEKAQEEQGTAESKADAKREALRRELEAKARAPVRKKRKF